MESVRIKIRDNTEIWAVLWHHVFDIFNVWAICFDLIFDAFRNITSVGLAVTQELEDSSCLVGFNWSLMLVAKNQKLYATIVMSVASFLKLETLILFYKLIL